MRKCGYAHTNRTQDMVKRLFAIGATMHNWQNDFTSVTTAMFDTSGLVRAPSNHHLWASRVIMFSVRCRYDDECHDLWNVFFRPKNATGWFLSFLIWSCHFPGSSGMREKDEEEEEEEEWVGGKRGGPYAPALPCC